MQLSFILVEPAVPENIGAAARALNTMGFANLRLVNPVDYLSNEARWLAHGSVDILEKAEVYPSFTDAIADLDFTIGTTAKKRSSHHDYYTPEAAKECLLNKAGMISKAGIVFGREESGLKNAELAQCDIASTILLNKPYPSLNLAQGVMLYAYIFSSLVAKASVGEIMKENATPLYRELKVNAKDILEKLNISKGDVIYGRMIERLATTNEDDARLFLSFAKKFKQVFE